MKMFDVKITHEYLVSKGFSTNEIRKHYYHMVIKGKNGKRNTDLVINRADGKTYKYWYTETKRVVLKWKFQIVLIMFYRKLTGNPR